MADKLDILKKKVGDLQLGFSLEQEGLAIRLFYNGRNFQQVIQFNGRKPEPSAVKAYVTFWATFMISGQIDRVVSGVKQAIKGVQEQVQAVQD